MYNKEIENNIKKDFQIIKFCFYGFLKNLKFFEPFLILFLLERDMNLFQIGLLISIREIIINILEIPSGIIADYFGRKKELYFCFFFYIISFIFFFFVKNFYIAVIAMIFFGLGEAFRSGTHKAIIFSYLEIKSWQEYKSFIYGRTRASSLIASALSSLISIIIILNIPSLNFIFLFSIIPYILDLLLIISYPKILDKSDKRENISIKKFIKEVFKGVKENKKLRKLLFAEGLFEASISSIKDLVQPILATIIISSGFNILKGVSVDNKVKISLGILYFFINIFGMYASKNSYKLTFNFSINKILNIIFVFLILLISSLSLCINNILIVCIVFILINVIRDLRKPLFIESVDNNMKKEERATILSVATQLKAFFVIIAAPLVGFIADNYNLSKAFLFLAIILLLVFPFVKNKDYSKEVML